MTIQHSNANRVEVVGELPARQPAAPEHAGPAGANDEHFRTDHLLDNLKGRTVSSGFITLTSQFVQFALTLGSTMILARLLEPRDFGLLAMVFTIMGFLRVFKEAGLSTATVQREGITHAQVSNLFWINAGVSGLVSLLVAAMAPLIAWFYKEPRLIEITLVLSITFLLAGLGVQHMALLNRQMRFKAVAVIQVGSVLAGVLAGVLMALFKYGYWSLVGLNLTTGVVALLLTWSLSRWRPQFFVRRSGTRSLLHFGANLTAGAFFYSLARGLDGLLLGRFYGAAAVGIYSRAAAMLTRPLEQFMGPIEAVFIPAFSRLQSRPERFRESFLQVYETIALVSFLFTGMCFGLAHPLTLVLLGAKWESAAVIFAGFTFAALQYPLTTSTTWLFTCQGRGGDSFRASWIIAIVVAVSFVAGLPFGAAGVAIAYSTSCLIIQMPLIFWMAGRRGPVRTSDLWLGFLRHLPVWLVVCGVVWLVRLPIPDDQPLKELILATLASMLAGIVFILAYPPSRVVALNLLSTIREFKNPMKITDTAPVKERVKTTTSPARPIQVSVIIPTYNREKFVVNAIQSVLRQTFKDYELIVVDDGSTDGTRVALKPFADQINYVYQKNAGVSAARNTGITLAVGEWIAFLDSDDEWSMEYLAKQMQEIGRNNNLSMQIADCRFSDLNGEQPSYFEVNGAAKKFNGVNYIRPPDPFDFLLRNQCWQLGSTIMRREALTNAGLFDAEIRMEDLDLMLRVALEGSVGLMKEKLVVAFRRNETIENLSRIAKTNPIWSRRSDDRLYQKLSSLKQLSRVDRQAIKWARSANQRAIGNLLCAEGKQHEARVAYWLAFKIEPSLRSFGKFLFSYFRMRPNRIPLNGRNSKSAADGR